jgi:flagellar hook protein FlgE
MQDGTSVPIYQLTLQSFSDPQALQKQGENLYTAGAATGKQFPAAGADVFQTPGTSGLGNIRSGYLELSNVDLGQEFSDMIRAQRGLQANARTITTCDEIMQDLINLKR